MYTDIQEPMLNATQEQVQYGPQKTYHTAADNCIMFISRNDTSKSVKINVSSSVYVESNNRVHMGH